MLRSTFFMTKSDLRFYAHELVVFTIKQARACIFAGLFFVLLFLSRYLPLGPLPRYDFLFIAAVAIQIALYCLNCLLYTSDAADE